MNFQAAKAIFRCKLSTQQKILLLAYANFMNEEETKCWPSQNTLSDMTDMSVSSVYRAKVELEKL